MSWLKIAQEESKKALQENPVTYIDDGSGFRIKRKTTVISFDFDGTILIPTINPSTGECNYDGNGEPVGTLSPIAAELMRRYKTRGDKVVIVTSRNPKAVGSIWKMIHDKFLPVSEVYATNHQPKSPVLKDIGATIHYDNSPFHIEEINSSGSTTAFYETEMEKHLKEFCGTDDK